MAAIAKHLSLFLMSVLLSDSLERTYGRDSLFFGKATPPGVDDDGYDAIFDDGNVPVTSKDGGFQGFADSSQQEDEINDDKFTEPLRLHEEGINHGGLVKKNRNSDAGKGDDSVNAAAFEVAELAKSLAEEEEEEDDDVDIEKEMNSYGIKPISKNYKKDRGGMYYDDHDAVDVQSQQNHGSQDDVDDGMEDDVDDDHVVNFKDSRSDGVRYANYINDNEDDEDMP